jgi:hypothetical protein
MGGKREKARHLAASQRSCHVITGISDTPISGTVGAPTEVGNLAKVE